MKKECSMAQGWGLIMSEGEREKRKKNPLLPAAYAKNKNIHVHAHSAKLYLKHTRYLFIVSLTQPSIFILFYMILFQRLFLLELCILLTVYFYNLHTDVTSFTHFTLHFLCIGIGCAEYFLIPDDAVDRQKLGFQFLLLNSSSRPQQNSFIHSFLLFTGREAI